MIMEQLLLQNIVEDGFFAAMAAIGFSSISHTPKRTFIISGLAAAAGHALRYVMMSPSLGNINIILASTTAAFVVGLIAVLMAPLVRVPAEACLYPSLLPMIPGMYAYRAVEALISCVSSSSPDNIGSLYSLAFNSTTCLLIILGMVIGPNIPIFLFKKISFQTTR